MNTLKKSFLDGLADRYDAEKRLIRAIPKMAKASPCGHLQRLIQFHLKDTKGHVKKLEAVFESFGAKVNTRKCEATVGFLKEGDEIAADGFLRRRQRRPVTERGAWPSFARDQPASSLLDATLTELSEAANVFAVAGRT